MLIPVVINGYAPRLVILDTTNSQRSLALHYSKFFRLPLLETHGTITPRKGFVVWANMAKDIGYYFDQDIELVDMFAYPHKNKKNANYFISWVIQQQKF